MKNIIKIYTGANLYGSLNPDSYALYWDLFSAFFTFSRRDAYRDIFNAAEWQDRLKDFYRENPEKEVSFDTLVVFFSLYDGEGKHKLARAIELVEYSSEAVYSIDRNIHRINLYIPFLPFLNRVRKHGSVIDAFLNLELNEKKLHPDQRKQLDLFTRLASRSNESMFFESLFPHLCRGYGSVKDFNNPLFDEEFATKENCILT